MGIIKRSLLLVTSSLCLSLGVGPAFADCFNNEDPRCLCHNIGGPMDLGANCDGTGNCTFYLEGDGSITIPENNFLGIIIPPTSGGGSAGAVAAHIAHGDGYVMAEFNPPLHLASTGQIHKASNVECLAERILPQPPEPGN